MGALPHDEPQRPVATRLDPPDVEPLLANALWHDVSRVARFTADLGVAGGSPALAEDARSVVVPHAGGRRYSLVVFDPGLGEDADPVVVETAPADRDGDRARVDRDGRGPGAEGDHQRPDRGGARRHPGQRRGRRRAGDRGPVHVYTRPDTAAGDSCAALVDGQGQMVGFCSESTGPTAVLGMATWVWAEQVFTALGLRLW